MITISWWELLLSMIAANLIVDVCRGVWRRHTIRRDIDPIVRSIRDYIQRNGPNDINRALGNDH